VEDEETWALLELFGADQAQGYYLSRPLPPEAILAPSIAWSERLSVHIPEIDGQHQGLILLINKLHDAMNRGKGTEVLQDVLGELVAYTRIHFATEERLMREHDYPDYDDHKAAHDAFADHVNATFAMWTQGQAVITMQLAQYLRDWMANHIQGMDKKFGEYVSAEARRALHEPDAAFVA
jgi:hemerythrin